MKWKKTYKTLHCYISELTPQPCMAIRKETALSSLMYVRERELYSVSYPLQCKVCLMVSSAILSSITSRCSGNEPRASPSSRGEPRELQKSRLVSLSKFLYFEYVSGLYKFVVLTICSQECCVIWSFFPSYASRQQWFVTEVYFVLLFTFAEASVFERSFFDIWYN